MLKVTAVWQGFAGAPGFSNFYFDAPSEGGAAANSAANKVDAFFQAIKGRLPPSVNVTVQTAVGQVDEQTGVLSQEFEGNVFLPVVGTNPTATFAAPAGAVINWKTATIVAGRKLRGRTFIVPLSTDCYQSDGTLSATTLAILSSAAGDLMAAGLANLEHLVVWHRPVAGVGGDSGDVTAFTVPDKSCILTSRRG